jgi:protein-arginine kinase activator protein McsA
MKEEDLTQLSTSDLNSRLEKAIEAEDYIMAAKIRDEINRRKGDKA